ncbi:C4-dicarboxylic acid transporter DauA [Moritella sp. 28]|uniref:C4-dicarboxylic acid transporter DauA n=1 Tax=Moritella sp. 28 TaxID=2746232 RepID=UPI001BA61784|nr:C4-dicarboxylic acid transporter DauA [Moritella sp. 28]QUM83540.1 C4-dicarboxylic acid transporter DauA [Moritella sp. 28]
MQQRAHLFSLRIAHALRESINRNGYNSTKFGKDLLAGITVGIIAIPLAMALAIACGVAPQYGLYTAIIGGIVIAISGGSRYSISGPTAAFVVILYPIVQQYGFGGLLLATIMSGLILVIMAILRLGRFIEYIPEAVTLGFTAGIAVVIATLQFNDILGLPIESLPDHDWDKLASSVSALPELHLPSFTVAIFTLVIMLIWPKFKTVIPAHLPAVIFGSLFALVLNNMGMEIATIGSRFHYLLPDGSQGAGIPPYLPTFDWPWLQAGVNGQALVLSWTLLSDLLPAAFAIAMLGAIESLLCAVVLDGMTGKRHSANSELLGQGIGNIVVPFFGGITATAAIARSAANVKAGAQTPISAVIHGLVVLASLVLFAPLFAYLPMPSMAVLLLVVAWNMSEAGKVLHLLKTAPKSDLWVFAICFSFTILFDMVLAITAGILLAAVLFMKEIAEMVKVTDITNNKRIVAADIPAGWRVFKINGPLFFAAADRVFSELAVKTTDVDGLVLYLEAVPLLDAGGLAAMDQFINQCKIYNTQVIFCDLQFQPLKTLARAGVQPIGGVTSFSPTLHEALRDIANY